MWHCICFLLLHDKLSQSNILFKKFKPTQIRYLRVSVGQKSGHSVAGFCRAEIKLLDPVVLLWRPGSSSNLTVGTTQLLVAIGLRSLLSCWPLVLAPRGSPSGPSHMPRPQAICNKAAGFLQECFCCCCLSLRAHLLRSSPHEIISLLNTWSRTYKIPSALPCATTAARHPITFTAPPRSGEGDDDTGRAHWGWESCGHLAILPTTGTSVNFLVLVTVLGLCKVFTIRETEKLLVFLQLFCVSKGKT